MCYNVKKHKGLIQMRLKVNKSKNSVNYYIITDTKTKDGKRSTKVFKKLGNEQEIDKICKYVSDKYKFEYDLNSILSRLLYGRIIYPSSKLATYNLSKNFIEQLNFELQHIYRALEVIAKENESIQALLYKNSLKVSNRNTGIIYYDCTNYFFEIEQEEGLKQYGPSKEHRPNPIAQMGLFMDGNGLKYRNYQRNIRNAQIERAQKAIETKDVKLEKNNQNDFKRFVKKTAITKDGEVAEEKILTIDIDQIKKEKQYDGFYGVCTNLDDEPKEIIKVNQMRWQIEESFRIMKSEFKARPVYLSRDDRITAHFTTCFLSLVIHRDLEKVLMEKFTSSEIIHCLRNMNMVKEDGGYIPAYTKTDLTDAIHEKSSFRTDYEIISDKNMKTILKDVKNKKSHAFLGENQKGCKY